MSKAPCWRRPLTKNVGVPVTPLWSAVSMSSADARGVDAAAQLVGEPVDVEAELAGVADEIRRHQRVLVLEQQVVHLPELALRRRRLGRLGRELGVRVDVGERQVAEDVAQVVAELRHDLAHDRLGAAAEGALEVAVLDERDGRARRSRGRGHASRSTGTARSTSRSEVAGAVARRQER